jgi:FHS family L-fucose permease-like MFS transporter
MLVAWTYAMSVNFIPAYRETVDKVGASTIGLENGGHSGNPPKDVEAEAGAEADEKLTTPEAIHIENK